MSLFFAAPQDLDAGTFLLVRHAEKEKDGTSNPNLDEAGQERATALVQVVANAAISAVYSTDLCRTAQTVDPFLATVPLPLRVQGVSGAETDPLASCEPALQAERKALASGVDDVAKLADYLKEKHPTDTVLVVGHSNTIPNLIEALIGADYRVELSEDDYGDLFIVESPALFGEPSLIHARFGR